LLTKQNMDDLAPLSTKNLIHRYLMIGMLSIGINSGFARVDETEAHVALKFLHSYFSVLQHFFIPVSLISVNLALLLII